MMGGKGEKGWDPATKAFMEALRLLEDVPMLSGLMRHAHVMRNRSMPYPPGKWAFGTSNGEIFIHPTRRAEPTEWVYIIAHCLLHLGFDHFREHEHFNLWNVACDCFIARFLFHLKLGKPPVEMAGAVSFAAGSEEALYREFAAQGVPSELQVFSTAGAGHNDLILEPAKKRYFGGDPDWQKLFSRGLCMAVSKVISDAANVYDDDQGDEKELTIAQKARRWFISSYPLLGSLSADFRLIEDPVLCIRMRVSVAAVNAELKEIYVNPAAALDEAQCRFVLAHELLHVGLNHHSRSEGRDFFLWNVACDFVINGWLMEMNVGDMPDRGTLYDPELKGLSAEAVYDRMATDMRRFRKLTTLRGTGLGDMLEGAGSEWWRRGDGMALDEFYRRCLGQGLVYHQTHERGYLPAGLIEEIRALSQPPIPWDVELARWFDVHFLPVEQVRSYARQSRRQSSTPDIPRPRWTPMHGAMEGRTFGVILDTSGSMDRNLLAKALGAISGYSISRDVPRVRVVFCDAATYDQGYMAPEDIAESVKIRGRGGTVLQPAVALLENAADFPKDGPILIITDGYCDPLRIRREHAFVIPRGRRLPFAPRGEVFYMD